VLNNKTLLPAKLPQCRISQLAASCNDVGPKLTGQKLRKIIEARRVEDMT
jgi:hypothetical protein